jgi:hypothetical protein
VAVRAPISEIRILPCFYPLIRSPSPAFLRQTSLQDPHCFQTTIEVFEQGLQTAGENTDCIGYRPKVSDEPLQFADHFVWQTYGEVDIRRKNLGSAIQGLFNSGDAPAVGGLETVALWSMNIPGEFSLAGFITEYPGCEEGSWNLMYRGVFRMADHRPRCKSVRESSRAVV